MQPAADDRASDGLTTSLVVDVRCGDDEHRLVWFDDHLEPLDHDLTAEAVLDALGGPVPDCLQIVSLFQDPLLDGVPGLVERLESDEPTPYPIGSAYSAAVPNAVEGLLQGVRANGGPQHHMSFLRARGRRAEAVQLALGLDLRLRRCLARTLSSRSTRPGDGHGAEGLSFG